MKKVLIRQSSVERVIAIKRIRIDIFHWIEELSPYLGFLRDALFIMTGPGRPRSPFKTFASTATAAKLLGRSTRSVQMAVERYWKQALRSSEPERLYRELTRRTKAFMWEK